MCSLCAPKESSGLSLRTQRKPWALCPRPQKALASFLAHRESLGLSVRAQRDLWPFSSHSKKTNTRARARARSRARVSARIRYQQISIDPHRFPKPKTTNAFHFPYARNFEIEKTYKVLFGPYKRLIIQTLNPADPQARQTLTLQTLNPTDA